MCVVDIMWWIQLGIWWIKENKNKIIYGSDAALLSQAAHLGLVGYERIPENKKVKILTRNVVDLLNRR